jgi:aminobenzoyl-glutamate transport protein
MTDPNPDAPAAADARPSSGGGLLDIIERIGNRLPDPATLFLLGLGLVMLISWAADAFELEVVARLPEMQMVDGAPALDEAGKPMVEWIETGEVLEARSLISREGLYWIFETLVDNFIGFAPLGVVLVGMLGIGIAERTGFIPAILKAFMLVVPSRLLTPAMIFIGIMSSMTMDAGYVILPPLAAALYKAVGRPPLAGLAAVFAGVAAGFNANLFITGLDPMLAQLAETGTRVIDESYRFNPAANWWFMIASTFVITLAGWAITSWFVERRLLTKAPEDGGPVVPSSEDVASQRLGDDEIRGMRIAGASFGGVFAVIIAAVVIPGMPLYDYHMPDPARAGEDIIAEVVELAPGQSTAGPGWAHAGIDEAARTAWDAGVRQTISVDADGMVFLTGTEGADAPANAIRIGPVDEVTILVPGGGFPRWVNAIVPLLFVQFIVPAIVYGLVVGTIRSDRDVARLMIESMAAMAPIIVLAFFAAQFIEAFRWSGLDRMLAMAGGQVLGRMDMPVALLLVAFIAMTMIFNMFIGSMSAKYAMFAPIFIPMFMMVGIAPELTQAAYRIGDSVSNIITPLNAYLIIVLVFMQKFVPRGGMGTLISTMLPYTIGFAIVWTIMLLVWVWLGIPLGPDGHLTYPPTP